MVTKEQLTTFFQQEFHNADFEIQAIGNQSATIRQPIDKRHLRPGGTVSGPVIMGLADAALYVAIFADLGLMAMAVTTNLNFNFLRKPSADKALIATCKLLKVGKSMVVGEVAICSEGDEALVAHAVGTYTIPPKH